MSKGHRVNGEAASEPDPRVYRVLGELYLQRPTETLREDIHDWATEWLDTAADLPEAIEAPLERIRDGSRADVQTLRQAYTHLFRGISERNSPAPPYESLQRDGRLFTETTTEVRQGYCWAGVDVDAADDNEPADHLGIELQFLAELLAMDDSDRGPDDPEITDAKWWLLDEHLLAWVPAYRDRIQDADAPAFYAGVVDLTVALVEIHHDRLAETR